MKSIISVSRRTDIPAHYYDWLQKSLKNGYVSVPNPMVKGKSKEVDLTPENIHSIVLWSKDMSNVLKNPGELENYNLYFQYTITGYSKFLEPGVPEYRESIKTLEGLLKKYKPEQFNIRFDPIIISNKGEVNSTPTKPGLARLNKFEELCRDLKSIGMDNCRVTTSYLSLYGQVAKNIKRFDLDVVDLTEDMQIKFLERMVEIADKYGRNTIYTCSNPVLEAVNGVKKGHCIDGELLSKLFGKCSMAKDTGQRKECGCFKSLDIGNYNQGCLHACRYCYANPILI